MRPACHVLAALVVVSLGAGAICLPAGQACAAAISINFVGKDTPEMESAESAGVAPYTQAHWNNATSGCGSLLDLCDADGLATGVSAEWKGEAWYNGGITDTAGNERMMRGLIQDPGLQDDDLLWVTVSGLGTWFASGHYDVIVYFDRSETATFCFTIADQTIWGRDMGTDFGGDDDSTSASFVEAAGSDATAATSGNYVRFRGLTAPAFTLNAVSQGVEATINGLQIVHVPEPVTFSFLAVGLAGLLLMARKKGRSPSRTPIW